MSVKTQRFLFSLLFTSAVCLLSYSQKLPKDGLSGGVDVGIGGKNGAYHASITYYELTSIAKSESFFLGWTGRLGAFKGKDLPYYTAPARLTRGRSGLSSLGMPLLTENIDTIRFDRALQVSLNIGIRAEYYVGPVSLGASIDLLGVTFGPTQTGLMSSSNGLFLFEDASGTQVYKPFQGTDVYQTAQPYWLNLALPGDLNRGMLTTEAYLRLRLTQGISIKAGYQWLTTEMAIKNKDVVSNNSRFRHRADFLYFGITAPLTPW